MSKHLPKARRVVSSQQPSVTLGGRETAIPHYMRGEYSHHEPTRWITLDEARSLRKRGLGEFCNRGRAFRSLEKAQADEEADYGPSRSRATSRKIAEPQPTGQLLFVDKYGEVVVPMGTMSRFVADQCAGRRNTTVQRAVEGWNPRKTIRP